MATPEGQGSGNNNVDNVANAPGIDYAEEAEDHLDLVRKFVEFLRDPVSI